MRSVADYAHLMALRAPRPTLLIYNAMDDCCFRAGVVKQGVYTDIKPFFALMGSPGNLQWYTNKMRAHGCSDRQPGAVLPLL